MLFSILFVIGTFLLNARGEWRYSEWVSLAMTIGWAGAAWRSCAMRGPSTSIPTSLSQDELRVFHRGALLRQRNLGYRVFLYWSAPALLLILYGLAVGVLGFRGGLMLLGAVSMQSFLIAWVYRNERRRYERELDRLDQELRQP